MFAAPFTQNLAPNAGGVSEVPRKSRSLPKLFSEIFGKSIDGPKRECLLGNLSLTRKRFFEIYFVRLIGTPNQNIPDAEQVSASKDSDESYYLCSS